MVTLSADDPEAIADLDLARYGEFGPADEARLAGARPLGIDDVLAMHSFLAGYGGDVRALLADAGGGGGKRQGPALGNPPGSAP